MPIKVLIVDDHQLVREGIKLILESREYISVAGEARNGREAVTQAEAMLPDVLLMDISMPELNGLEATRILRASVPSVKVIILSMHNTSEFVFRATKAGAKGFVIKDSAGIEVHKAIRAVMNGRQYIGHGVDALPVGPHPVPEITGQSPLSSLSLRERETMQLVVEGKTNVTIAKLFNVSPKSVETYRYRLMQKLGVGNVADLVKFALLHGVISLH